MVWSKLNSLRGILAEYSEAAVAFSGGVDSAFLLKLAIEVVPGRVVAITFDSPVVPSGETAKARETANNLGVEHRIINWDELKDPSFCSNSPERCYYCKKGRYQEIWRIARVLNLPVVLDGSNFSDLRQKRPGRRAVKELGVCCPLEKVQLFKEEIRELARQLGLGVWDKPAQSCLATRISHGHRISREELERVAQAETYFRRFGYRQFRIRVHNELIRIELSRDEIGRFLKIYNSWRELGSYFRSLGYKYITLDIEGYENNSGG